MTTTLTENVLATLAFPLPFGAATAAVLAVWFKGDLFAHWRARAEAVRDDPGPGPVRSFGRFFGELLTCPFCFSYHVAGALTLVGVVAGLLPWPVAPFVWLAGQLIGHQLFLQLRPTD